MPSPSNRRGRRSLRSPARFGGRSVVALTGIVLLGSSILAGCRRDREMADRVELPDTTTLMRAMEGEAARDSMLDTLPGGEMARGDSAMEMKLLKDKM